MDELKEAIVNLKVESKVLKALKESILDNSRLSYVDGLRLEDSAPVLAIIKAFYPEEYANRVKALEDEVNKRKEAMEDLNNG